MAKGKGGATVAIVEGIARPVVELAPLDWRELAAQEGARVFHVPEAGAVFVSLWEPLQGGGEGGI